MGFLSQIAKMISEKIQGESQPEIAHIPRTSIPFYIDWYIREGRNDYVSINAYDKELFDGDVIARQGEYYLAEGFSNNKSAFALFTDSRIVKKKYAEDAPEYSLITPDGTAVILTDCDHIILLSEEKTSTRSFEYFSAYDDWRIATDKAFAYIDNEYGDGYVTLKCFVVSKLSTWTKKLKYKEDEDDDDWDEREPGLAIDDETLEISLSDGEVCHYSINGEKL